MRTKTVIDIIKINDSFVWTDNDLRKNDKVCKFVGWQNCQWPCGDGDCTGKLIYTMNDVKHIDCWVTIDNDISYSLIKLNGFLTEEDFEI